MVMDFCDVSNNVDVDLENNSTRNGTHKSHCIEINQFVLGMAMTFLVTIIVASNSTVIVICFKNKKINHTLFCMIINLAIADLAVGLFDMPLMVIEMMIGHWDIWNKVCTYVVFFGYVPLLGSLLSKVAIACNRYYSLSSPQYNRQTCSRRQRNFIEIVLIWSLSGGAWYASTFMSQPVELFAQSNCMRVPSLNIPVAISISVVAHHIPSVIIVYLNSVILVYVRMLIIKRASMHSSSSSKQTEISAATPSSNVDNKSNTKVSKESGSSIMSKVSSTVRRSLGIKESLVPEALRLAPVTLMFQLSVDKKGGPYKAREIRVAHALIGILLVHIVLTLPSNIMYDVHIASKSQYKYHPIRFLIYANSAVNPFLYAFSSEEFQRAFRQTMGWIPDNIPAKKHALKKRSGSRRRHYNEYYHHVNGESAKIKEVSAGSEHSVDPISYRELQKQVREQLVEKHIQIESRTLGPTPTEGTGDTKTASSPI